MIILYSEQQIEEILDAAEDVELRLQKAEVLFEAMRQADSRHHQAIDRDIA